MRAVLLAAALAACASPQAGAQQGDPLAPARGGAIECIGANVAARTCEIVSTYRFLPNGEIMNDYIMLIQNDPVVLAYGYEAVFLRDGMVCSPVGPADLEAMRFTIDGAPAPAEVTAELRAVFAQALAGVQEICVRYTPAGDRMRVTVFADGVEQPDLAVDTLWVRPEDGYTVGGAAGAET